MSDEFARKRDALARQMVVDAVKDAEMAGAELSEEERAALRVFWQASFPVSFLGEDSSDG